MIFITNSCVFGCVTVASLMLLNNIVVVFAIFNRNSNVIRSKATIEDSTLISDRLELSNNITTTQSSSVQMSTTVKSMEQDHDDRLYFELPQWFKRLNKTKNVIETPAIPGRLDTDDTTDQIAINTITVDDTYTFRVCLDDGTIHAERGDYEFRDGKRVFVIRGYFRHISPTGKLQMKSSPYIFDHTGLHILPDYEPSPTYSFNDSDCAYCIDQKLQSLLNG